MCGINWNQKKQRSLILYTFSLYNTFCNKLLTNNIYLLNIYYERSLQLKHKKTLLTFLMLCGLFILSKPVSAAKVPVIKAGKSTNLKGTIINVKYSGAAVTMANKSATPSIKIGSEIYVPCKTLFADNGIHASYTANGNTVTVKNGKRKVIFYANKKYAKVNGKKMTLKAAPYFVTYKKSNIRDIMTGYRAFSYQFVKTFPVLSKGFEIETEMSIHAVDKNMLVENVIIDYRDRPDGSESKLNTYSDGARVLKTIMGLYKNYKPMQFFGLLALILAIIAVAMFAPVFTSYLKTGLVAKFPTLIVSGFVAMASLQSFFAGLILSTIVQKDRQ